MRKEIMYVRKEIIPLWLLIHLLLNDFFSHSSIRIATIASIFLFLNVSKTYKGITLKIFSGNATVSLLLMSLQFLVLFCIKTVSKEYISC